MSEESDSPIAAASQTSLEGDPATEDPAPSTVTEILAEYYEHSVFSGPLPPPTILKQYNEMLPGSAERILRAWETESRHRREIESHVVKAEYRGETRGQWLAFCLALAILGAAIFLIQAGHDIAGIAAIIAEIAALVVAFAYGRRGQVSSPGSQEETEEGTGGKQLSPDNG